jgi:lipid-A-disaccharide synthase-like uncharacterized protein
MTTVATTAMTTRNRSHLECVVQPVWVLLSFIVFYFLKFPIIFFIQWLAGKGQRTSFIYIYIREKNK